MTFRDDAIQATEGIFDALGEPVLFQSASGGSKTIIAPFEREFFDPEIGVGVLSTIPVLFAKSSDGPFNEGDTFIVDDITYKATPHIERDADGMTRIGLHKVG